MRQFDADMFAKNLAMCRVKFGKDALLKQSFFWVAYIGYHFFNFKLIFRNIFEQSYLQL